MKPAARLGDQTTHGTPLTGTASPNVLIGKQPAWRALADVHTCPFVSGTVPHVGGTVSNGSTSVLINDLPAARLGDTIVENGPPNTIASGCQTVLIG